MQTSKVKKIPTVRFISLGCPKNLVDTEVMTGLLHQKNYRIVSSETTSDVGVINTCGFIEASKKESIDTILKLAEEKKQGKLKLLVVSGCLSQRYAKELPALLPEVDAFIGTGDFSRLDEIIQKKLGGETTRNFIRYPDELYSIDTPRLYLTPSYTRFIKISEGCSHTCSFCTIPLMRGNLKSRTSNNIAQEIKQGASRGVKEFNLIAQDLNEYGRDLPERDSLYHLLEKTGGLSGSFWIRLLYMYPLQFPDKLITLIKNHPHVIPYVDIPLQHIDDEILKSMKRGSSSKYIHRLLEKLKTEIPHLVLRTTFITGYPGETESAFGKLLNFIKETKFDRLGVFTYSKEDQTMAAKLPNPVPEKIKQERRDEIMKTQQKISLEKNKALVGKKIEVLFEGELNATDPETDYFVQGVGRYEGQAPEIDGQVFLDYPDSNKPTVGEFITATVTKGFEYDLVARVESSKIG
ncbi:MAG: ribosomal protein S12 methylthiotransferase RimO [Deltaproteobacteria bacterium RIFCSPLOWO2_12_FULL_40_28]|nr:MAG: ribosomal protein S12 methylthiotransferase RimO [Deltaproteobacteria bacterium RIFCSPHIGHO2_02_FULL_40_28]OGQ20064.1 MAG: ribosomal protein S12 methylthiotransferase RimO [Deltaproteobacteria bacterium RIFCSPHIGHO2_12_FULL_40_32]OGQ40631.1 MAG: ribosomal protein S12 methylthiotransferase RimO [Deltaproteobacteria bacterium RIFCSPLOWO2_02_FULL_40_36]OGQ54300.1 MAG: ribosomal protein S12 methylthiotransferase RimO [Deltaproteobacteria bacterium RIFCSPLOWO2_12_FULL_40_28]